MKKSINLITKEQDLFHCENVEPIVNYLNKYWNIKAKPKGYDKLRKGYEDFDGMEEQNNEPLFKSFKGFNNSTAGSFSLPEQLNTPNVVYGECCQGRTPLYSIISAVFSYAFQCGAKYQELKYLDSFDSLIEFMEKMKHIKPAETPEKQVKELDNELDYVLKDIKHKLYFDSVVTDHSKLDEQ